MNRSLFLLGSTFLILALASCTSSDSQPPQSVDASVDVSPPEEIPSKQKVTFEITNATSADRFLMSKGIVCTHLLIEKQNGTLWDVLDTSITIYDATSMCCEPGCDYEGTGAKTFTLLAPGGKTEMTWDARAYVLSTETYSCQAKPGFHWGARQPVSPGTYRVTVGVEQTLPWNCHMMETSTEASCSFTMGSAGKEPHTFLCSTSMTASTVFTLAPTGDAVVSVPIQ